MCRYPDEQAATYGVPAMNDENKFLREELAKLRERVAVLERSQAAPPVKINPLHGAGDAPQYYWPTLPPSPRLPGSQYRVTCGDANKMPEITAADMKAFFTGQWSKQ